MAKALRVPMNPRISLIAALAVVLLGSVAPPIPAQTRSGIRTTELASAWKGYAASFSSPAQIPFLSALNLDLSSPERMESFVRVMARAELDPQALRSLPQAAEQAALVRTAIVGYGQALGRQSGDPERTSEDSLREASRELEDLSAFAELVPEEERRLLADGHKQIESLIAQRSGERSAAVAAHIERVQAAWTPKDASAPPLAPAPPRPLFDRTWALQKGAAGAPQLPSRLFVAVPASHFDSVILNPRNQSRILSSLPVRFVRSTYGVLARIGSELLGGMRKRELRPAVDASRLAVVREGDSILLRRATEVPPEEISRPEFQRFLDDLAYTMEKAGGTGLAAPQVGRSVRAVVVKLPDRSLILINPRITILGSDVVSHLEGCLSIPGGMAFVPRPQKIKVDYLDREGRAQSVILSGFSASIAQHEIDHLDGILFTMRARNPLRKLGKVRFRAISESTRLEFAWFSAQMKKHPGLEALNAKLFKGFHDAVEPDSLAYALREGLDQPTDDDVFKEILAYYKIRLDSHEPREKAERLRSWLKSPAHALFAYDDLAAETLEGDGELLRELTARVPQIEIFMTPYLRGPPHDTPKTVMIPDLAGKSKKQIVFDSVTEAVEFARLAKKYALVTTPQGPRLTFPSPDGAILVIVKSLQDARFLVESYETSAADDVRDLRLPTPPARNVQFNKDMPISFGLEAEMNVRENPDIVMDYRVDSFSEEDWLPMDRQARIQAALERQRRNPDKGERIFIKLSGASGELPAELLNEGDGNVEMNGMVFRSYADLERYVRDLFRRYGPSSLQAHVAYKDFDRVEGVAGYVVFEADAAQLKTLERNYTRFLADTRIIPGKNLPHHSLGPLGEDDRRLFARFELRALRGKSIGAPGNSRTTYAPVFRDDIYPDGYRGHEFRQFHKRADELLAAVDGFSAHLNNSGDLRPFKPFSEVRQIAADLPAARAQEVGVEIDKRKWRKFFGRVGQKITALNSPLVTGGAPPSERFFYPLKDWKNHPLVRELPEPERTQARARIGTATREFLLTIDALVNHSDYTPIYQSVLNQLQTAVAKWAYDTALSDHFETFRRRVLAAGPRAPPLERLPFVRSVLAGRERMLFHALPFQSEKFPNGREYLRSALPREFDPGSLAYETFLASTLEVIYQGSFPYGHIGLRVGGRFYSLNYVEDVTREYFRPQRVGKGKTGFVYSVDPGQIGKIQDELEKLVENSAVSNVPAFDAHTPKLEVILEPGGWLKYDSPYTLFANNRRIRARLVQEDGQSFLETADGFRYPVTEENGKLYTQSLACATLATYVMKNYFGIDIAFHHGAKSLRDALSRGNPGGRAPDAIIDY